MDVTSAKYHNDIDGNQIGIYATVNGVQMFVPLNPNNTHYAEIMRQLDAGDLTIQEAD